MTGREGDQFDQLRALIDDYWCLAWAEGIEGRNHDTETGDAQRVSSQIDRAIDTLRVQLEAAEADRDSWLQQASDRVKDWDEMRHRAEAGEAEVARLRPDAERFQWMAAQPTDGWVSEAGESFTTLAEAVDASRSSTTTDPSP